MSDGSPGRKPRVTDEDILAVFRSVHEPVLATSEVATELPIKRRATHNRLQSLVDAGELSRKQIGKIAIYWLPGYTATEPSRELAPDSEVKA